MNIKPMLLKEIDYSPDVFEKYKDWIFQEKQNGVRAIIHIKNGKVSSIRNRNNVPILNMFPEFIVAAFGNNITAIVDGEICVFRNNKSVFYDGIDKRHKKYHKGREITYPVKIVGFDLLYLNGENLINKPYSERYDKLQSIKETDVFEVAKNVNPEEYWDKVVKENREGLVAKNPKSRYELDTRSNNCLKIKNYKVCQVVVEKTEANNKGTKIWGSVEIDGEPVEVECQFGGVSNIDEGSTVNVRYLDVVNGKLIQPHKLKGEML